ncbi:MAG: response regulator [Deltaproteobacteria bacterium]|nr:response regulator [Deltaproteobacteria bacterium]
MKAPPRILLVDDSPENLEFLESRLKALGYRTTLVHDGAKAVESVRRDPPDLVVLDVIMPDVNGYQACREIKKLHKQLPVIILTCRSDPADRFWARETGADDFLTKPIDPQVVANRIASLVGQP